MAVATSSPSILRALIEEARRRARARRRRYVAILACAFVGASAATAGLDGRSAMSNLGFGRTGQQPGVIVTQWSETQRFANDAGVVRLYVRKLQFTRGTWKAWVGLTNASRATVTLLTHEKLSHNVSMPLTWVAAPGLWWQTYHREGGHWLPGAGWAETHVARSASINPRFPEKLAPKKSWFGVFSGSTAKLPRDRLLRVGFGVACICPENYQHKSPLSTDHTFKLPRG